jgi:hypothetical protein
MYIDATVFGHFIENALPDDQVHHTQVGYAATLPHASPTPIDCYTHPVNQWLKHPRFCAQTVSNREIVAGFVYITTTNKLCIISALRPANPTTGNPPSLIGIHGDNISFPQVRRLYLESALANVVAVLPSTSRTMFDPCMTDEVFNPPSLTPTRILILMPQSSLTLMVPSNPIHL